MGRVFCSADWHGCGIVANKVINFLAEDDILYFAGDAIDRGSYGPELLHWLLIDPRVRMVKGNHEQMLVEYLPVTMRQEWVPDDWSNNGGELTWQGLQKYSDNYKLEYIKRVKELPSELKYSSPAGHTVIIEHAGYTPGHFAYKYGHQDPLWDRRHFDDSWSYDKEYENIYLVHGHTPVQYLNFYYGYKGKERYTFTKQDYIAKKLWFSEYKTIEKPTIINYCEGHKFDIDMCTIVSNRIALLDLDTFEEIYFDEDK